MGNAISWCVRPSDARKASVLGIRADEVLTESARQERMFDALVDGLRNNRFRNIVVMCGAGISVNAGIPDFRSRTGLYNLKALYDLPHPMAVFSIDYFKENPRPFYHVMRTMLLKDNNNTPASVNDVDHSSTSAVGTGEAPALGSFQPTLTHSFFQLLKEKGVLRRVYTQNVDCLERAAGLDEKRELVQVHGTVASCRCSGCGAKQSLDTIRSYLLRPRPEATTASAASVGPIPSDGVPTCSRCATGVIKPDVVFFGEGIPSRLFTCGVVDFVQCDLLLCMGSTFQVMPFAQFINKVSDTCPRVVFNLENGSGGHELFGSTANFDFDSSKNYRDVFVGGDVDRNIRRLCDAVGWSADLERVHAENMAKRPVSIDELLRWEHEGSH